MHIINVADIEIEVERKSIKNLHLAVYPPDARVHISMPNLDKRNGNSYRARAIIYLVNGIN